MSEPTAPTQVTSANELRCQVVALGTLLGLTDEAFLKVFGLRSEVVEVVKNSVSYKSITDKLFLMLAESPEKALLKSESLAIRKLIQLIECGDKKLEFSASTEVLNRLRGKPISTTHLVSAHVNANKDQKQLDSDLKASQDRLQRLLDQRDKIMKVEKPAMLEVEAEILA